MYSIRGEHTQLLVGYSKKHSSGLIISKVFEVGGHQLVVVLQVSANPLATGGSSCIVGTPVQRRELESGAKSFASVFLAVVGESRDALGVQQNENGERVWKSHVMFTLMDQSGLGKHLSKGSRIDHPEGVELRCSHVDITAADLYNYPDYVTCNCYGFRNFVKFSELESLEAGYPRFIVQDTIILKCTIELLLPRHDSVYPTLNSDFEIGHISVGQVESMERNLLGVQESRWPGSGLEQPAKPRVRDAFWALQSGVAMEATLFDHSLRRPSEDSFRPSFESDFYRLSMDSGGTERQSFESSVADSKLSLSVLGSEMLAGGVVDRPMMQGGSETGRFNFPMIVGAQALPSQPFLDTDSIWQRDTR